MRFLVMHKNDARTEAGELPPATLIAEMGAFIGQHAASGRFLDGAGLRGSSTRTRLTFRAGACTVVEGPYRGEHELPAELLILSVATREQGLGWAERYGRILGDGEIEVGALTEPWDLGMMPRPDDPPVRLAMVVKADADSEAGKPRSARQKAELTRLVTEMRKAGVVGTHEQLLPSSASKRLVYTDHARRVIDGPFSESKELIGGFSIMRFDRVEEVLEMCDAYAKILGGTLEIDVRPLAEPDAA